MKLSVIIPCYNAEETLANQLKAIGHQDFDEPWEIILVDNGSTDRSFAVAEEFQKNLANLRIIRAPARQSAAHARNQGAKVARGKLFLFCDADDEVAPGYVRAMNEALQEHPVVACRFEFEKLNQKWISHCHTAPQTSDVDRGLLGPYVYAGGGSLGVTRFAHEAVHGFDESLSALEDTDYCVRLQRHGFCLHFAQDPLVHVRWRRTVRHSLSQARRWGRCFIVVRTRHWPTTDAPDTPGSFLKHLLRLRRVRSSQQLAQWIWSVGWQIGSIEGWRNLQRTSITRAVSQPSSYHGK